ncbi:MAG: ABC transporter ATP-binding protein [Clostridiales bacterium]
MVSIQIENISFAYGNHQVLRDISFSALPGDLLCVLGPNGVGKSTLFRCMLGLQNGYYGGKIQVDGENIQDLSATDLAKKIAYIPQYHTPAFHYTVFNTVLMGTTPLFGRLSSPGKEHEKAVMEALDQFGIAHLRDRSCIQISGGERQLTLLARAIVQQAKILVLDEPTANLDYGNQIRVMREICKLAEKGYSIIISTHNPEHALLYANQVLVLLDGGVLRFGKPNEVVTSDLLRQIYRVDVSLEEIKSNTQTVRVCVPFL